MLLTNTIIITNKLKIIISLYENYDEDSKSTSYIINIAKSYGFYIHQLTRYSKGYYNQILSQTTNLISTSKIIFHTHTHTHTHI